MTLELTKSRDELRAAFVAMRTPRDLAALLDVEYSQLVYHIYKVPSPQKYARFQLHKRSGGTRIILAPRTSLKIIQRKLNQVLQAVYRVKGCVHGFVQDRSIVTNARLHIRSRYVLNIDLTDFFPSINFGRVRGMFMRLPYDIPATVSTVLAQICCHENQLPQGAPTSPIVANMICAKMDSEMKRLAHSCKFSYTRYADDISFSGTLSRLPHDLASVSEEDGDSVVRLGSKLRDIIRKNGFDINLDKVRLADSRHRQEVTGLVVNSHLNVRRSMVRQIRAMLHAWRKHGLEAAQAEHWAKYNRKHRSPDSAPPSFEKIVKGKIDFLSMVLGKRNRIYRRFLVQYAEMDKDFKIPDETGWDKVNRQIGEARKRLAEASMVEHYQGVGHICREVIISLGQTVYDESRHKTTDDTIPSSTDAKRMIEAYVAIELKGSHHEELRRLSKATWDLAVNLQHKRHATCTEARCCLSSTQSLVDQIAAVDASRKELNR